MINWGLFFGSIILVYLISYFVGYDNGFDDCKKNIKDMERFEKFRSLSQERKKEMKYEFVIVDDNGTGTLIKAECRTDAIKCYCQEKGCPEEYVKKHCIVKKYQGSEQNER